MAKKPKRRGVQARARMIPVKVVGNTVSYVVFDAAVGDLGQGRGALFAALDLRLTLYRRLFEANEIVEKSPHKRAENIGDLVEALAGDVALLETILAAYLAQVVTVNSGRLQ